MCDKKQTMKQLTRCTEACAEAGCLTYDATSCIEKPTSSGVVLVLVFSDSRDRAHSNGVTTQPGKIAESKVTIDWELSGKNVASTSIKPAHQANHSQYSAFMSS